MKIARIDGKAHLIDDSGNELRAADIEALSGGEFSSDVKALLPRLDELQVWSQEADWKTRGETVDFLQLQTPLPDPTQILAIGMNYQDHADEVNISVPESPAIFTKFSSSLTGASHKVKLPSAMVDWEVELVAVIGQGGRDIGKQEAWEHIAGYAVGQDLSCRELQFAASNSPQFSLGKSYEGFAPVGPWITTADEIDVSLGVRMDCRRGDEILQQGSTEHLIFDIPTLIEHISSVIELRTGDLIFTGTPDGVGFGRDPKEFLSPGDRLTSTIEGLGTIVQAFH